MVQSIKLRWIVVWLNVYSAVSKLRHVEKATSWNPLRLLVKLADGLHLQERAAICLRQPNHFELLRIDFVLEQKHKDTQALRHGQLVELAVLDGGLLGLINVLDFEVVRQLRGVNEVGARRLSRQLAGLERILAAHLLLEELYNLKLIGFELRRVRVHELTFCRSLVELGQAHNWVRLVVFMGLFIALFLLTDKLEVLLVHG